MRKLSITRSLLWLLPLLEIAGFIIVGGWIGVLPTLLLIVTTTIVGLAILRVQGFMTLLQIQRRMQAGEQPANEVLDTTLLMLGGFLLVIPGFITDAIGLLLLIPKIRSWLLRWLVAKGILVPGPGGAQPPPVSGRVIEGEFRREAKKKP